MDWSWSALADDVTALTDQLTVWELRLFAAGATAVQQWAAWQQQGKRRSVSQHHAQVVTPAASGDDDKEEEEDESPTKRPRLE